MEQYFVGFVFLLLGGMNVVRPDLMVRFQVWTQRAIMGAQYIPSERTYKVNRIFGAFFLLIGLIVITGAFSSAW